MDVTQKNRPQSNNLDNAFNRPIDRLQDTSLFDKQSLYNPTDKIQIPMNESLVSDYCQMLTPENNPEIQAFAIQSIDPMIDDIIRKIMSSTDLLMAVFSIIDYYTFPYEIQQSQFRILQKLGDHMNEARAFDILKRNGLSRLVKCYPSHNPRFQPIIAGFIQKIVVNGKKNFDVKSLFALTQTSLPTIQELGMKALVSMSENKDDSRSTNGTV